MVDPNYKVEPAPLDMKDVFDGVARYVHDQGEDSMLRLLEANKPAREWPIRLQLDVVLKMLLNGLGELQLKVAELEKRGNDGN